MGFNGGAKGVGGKGQKMSTLEPPIPREGDKGRRGEATVQEGTTWAWDIGLVGWAALQGGDGKTH